MPTTRAPRSPLALFADVPARAFALALALAASPAAADDAPRAEDRSTTSEAAAPSAAAKQFDRLKALAGTWSGRAGFGEPTDPTTVTYRLTAGGTALIETLFGGTAHEMVTVYHMDGESLMLTHYCATGTQPRMTCATSGDEATLRFDFLDGTSVDPETDTHMHAGWITFVDADHVRSGWTMYDAGKPGVEARFDLARQE